MFKPPSKKVVVAHKHRALTEKIKSSFVVNNHTIHQVLQAFNDTPRHLFVDEALNHHAYEDCNLSIGSKQTISKPSIVALMTSYLYYYAKHDKVLEIGTGCGYQTALLAKLWDKVYTVERIAKLHEKTKQRLDYLELQNIEHFFADGFAGLPTIAPFSAIMLTACCPKVPEQLLNQLAPNGILLAPIGNDDEQNLRLYQRQDDRHVERIITTASFVPMLSKTVAG